MPSASVPPSVSIFGTAARSPATFHPRTTCRCRRSLPSATPSPITPSCSTNAGTPPAPTHRLDRDLTGRFGSAAYAMEECTVELLSAMICADLNLNVEPRPDHARYIASWLEVLRSDKCAIFTAASKAQQIADWTRRSRRTLTTRSGAPRRPPPSRGCLFSAAGVGRSAPRGRVSRSADTPVASRPYTARPRS